MKNKPLLFALTAALLLCLVGFTYQAKPAPQYEYKIEYGLNEKKLNGLAAQGWELVAVGSEGATTTIITVYVLKRAK